MQARAQFDAETALAVWAQLRPKLSAVFFRLVLVGELRRLNRAVSGVSVLGIARCDEAFRGCCSDLAVARDLHVRALGANHAELVHCRTGLPLSVHLVAWDSWWTALLIRTGSEQFIKRISCAARRKGLRLHDDGRGIERPDGRFLKLSSERAVFLALGQPWVRPEARW